MGLSGAERQARWRAQRQAELEQLRAAQAAQQAALAALREPIKMAHAALQQAALVVPPNQAALREQIDTAHVAAQQAQAALSGASAK